MFDVIQVVAPIFGLIFSGYFFSKRNLLKDGVSQALNNYVIMLALPALLFKVTATSPIQTLWQPGFIWSIVISCLVIFLFIEIVYLIQKKPLVDATIKALSASYSNTGFMGFSICLFVFGEEGLLPALIATLIVACALYALSVILVELSTQKESHIHMAVFMIFKSTIKNPLVLSPLCGFAFSVSGIKLPDLILTYLSTVGNSATPCALISIGAFLAIKQNIKHDSINIVVLCKLLLQPLITWFCVFKVFNMVPMWGNAAILLSALPTGTGPYMLVNYYCRDAGSVSKIILVTTVISLASISLCIFLIKEGVLL